LRETFQLLDDPEFNQLGRQTWVLILIVITELLICIKFGWATITKPLPRHIALWWVLGALILIGYTFVKFYLLKPDHVPKPEKEDISISGNTPDKENKDENKENKDENKELLEERVGNPEAGDKKEN
jgi:phosphatidylserine synthase 2